MSSVSIKFLEASFIHNINYSKIYFEEIYKYIEGLNKKAESKLDDLSKETEEIFDMYSDQYIDDYHTADKILKAQFIYTVIINIYSVLEVSLRKLCEESREAKGIKLKISDLTGDGAQK